MANDNKLPLRIVVAGQEITVVANINAPLRTVAEHALAQAGHAGRQLSDWEFKDERGTALDLDKKVGAFGFAAGSLLYLTLKVGINGRR